MESPLARIILATLAGYLTILLALCIYDWIAEEFPRRPIEPTNSERVRHPIHHRTAIRARQRFFRLSEIERTTIKGSLESSLIPVEKWIKRLETSKVQIVCIGELHQEATRLFLAQEFFAKVSANALLLEATPKELSGLIKRMEAGREYFPLLDADIMAILRTVKERNPDIRIVGIEETAQQARTPQGTKNRRDQSIADNFWNTFEPGLRHIILFGALHCANESNWLFHNLRSRASPTLNDAMLNVRVLEVHQNGPLEAFVNFTDSIAIERNHFVIPDTRLLHPRIFEWFPHLNQETLDKYRTLIVFRR